MPAIFYVDFEGGDDRFAGDSFLVTASGNDGYTQMWDGQTGLFSSTASFDSSYIGRYISITGKTYLITGIPSSTGVHYRVIPGNGTGFGPSGINQDWWIGGRWQTLSTGASTARVQIGDTVRIMASPYPTSLGQSGLWAYGSRHIVLTSGVTKEIDPMKSGWTGYANTTVSWDTIFVKFGTGSLSVAVGTSANTGIVAYHTLPQALDLSPYQQVSFWTRNNVADQTGMYIHLCTDTTGTVIAHQIPIPASPITTAWMPVVYNVNTPLNSAIQSVSIWNNKVPASTATLRLDNLIACKATGEPDSLNLTSLISKNVGRETWWAIQSISGNIIKLDQGPGSTPSAPQGYWGLGPSGSENVETWKRETIKHKLTSLATATWLNLNRGGGTNEFTGVTYYIGGFDRTGMIAQVDETWIDGQQNIAVGLNTSQQLITIDRLSFCRFSTAIQPVGVRFRLKRSQGMNNNTTAYSAGSSTPRQQVVEDLWAINQNFSSPASIAREGDFTIYSCSSNLVTFACSSVGPIKIRNTIFGRNAVSISNSTYTEFINCVFTGNDAQPLQMNNIGGITVFRDCKFDKTTWTSNSPVVASYEKIISTNHNRISGFTVMSINGLELTMSGQTGITRSPGQAWGMALVGAGNLGHLFSGIAPPDLSIATVAVNSGTPVTASVWMYRTASGVTGMFGLESGALMGLDNHCRVITTGVTGQWENLSVTFTPGERGAVEYGVYIFGQSSSPIYVDDFYVTQN